MLPKFHKEWSFLYAVSDRVETELDSWVNNDIISQIAHSEWLTPIVPVLRKTWHSGSFKTTISACITEHYRLSGIEDIFLSLPVRCLLTTLDLKDNKLLLHDEAKKLAAISTLKSGITVWSCFSFRSFSAVHRNCCGWSSSCAFAQEWCIGSGEGNRSVLLNVLRKLRDNCFKPKAFVIASTKSAWTCLERAEQWHAHECKQICSFFGLLSPVPAARVSAVGFLVWITA